MEDLEKCIKNAKKRKDEARRLVQIIGPEDGYIPSTDTRTAAIYEMEQAIYHQNEAIIRLLQKSRDSE